MLLCRKPCSLKPCSAKPFPLHSLVVEGSHQGLDPSPVISKLYPKHPTFDNTHFLGSAPRGISSGVTDERCPTAASGVGSDPAGCPGHHQQSSLLFSQFATIQRQKKLFLLLTALYWLQGQHLACQPGSCSHSCKSCTLAEPACPCAARCLPLAWLAPHGQGCPAPAKSPWLSAPLGGYAGVDFCIFVTPALAPALWQLPYVFPPAIGFPWGVCDRADQAVYSAEDKRNTGWPDLDCHTAFLSIRLFQEKHEVFSAEQLSLPEAQLSQQPWWSYEFLLHCPMTPILLGRIWLCFAAQQMCVRNRHFSCPKSANPAFKSSLKYLVKKTFTWTWKHKVLLSFWAGGAKSKGKGKWEKENWRLTVVLPVESYLDLSPLTPAYSVTCKLTTVLIWCK